MAEVMSVPDLPAGTAGFVPVAAPVAGVPTQFRVPVLGGGTLGALATAAVPGLVKPGPGLAVAADGTLSSTGAATGGSTMSITADSGASHVLALADAGAVLEMSSGSANTVTIPADATVGFPVGTVVNVRQMGAGQTTVAAASGVTLRTPETAAIRTQYGLVTLHKRAANEWCLEGNLQVSP